MHSQHKSQCHFPFSLKVHMKCDRMWREGDVCYGDELEVSAWFPHTKLELYCDATQYKKSGAQRLDHLDDHTGTAINSIQMSGKLFCSVLCTDSTGKHARERYSRDKHVSFDKEILWKYCEFLILKTYT